MPQHARMVNGDLRRMSLAHDVSGLGSTRVVRFGVSVGRDRDEPDDVATGTQDADVSECAGALAGTTPVCAGGGGDAGDERAELPPLPAPLRGRWPGRIVRPKARQGVRAPRAGRPDRMGARGSTEPAIRAGRSSTSTTISAPTMASPGATPGPRPPCSAQAWCPRHPGAAPTVAGARASPASA